MARKRVDKRSELGVPKAETTHNAPWRGKTVEKDVFGTSQEAIEMGFKILDYATGEQKPDTSDEEVINAIRDRYNALNPEQKKQLKGEIRQILQAKYPELLKKFKI